MKARGGNKKEFRKRELKQFYKNKKSANKKQEQLVIATVYSRQLTTGSTPECIYCQQKSNSAYNNPRILFLGTASLVWHNNSPTKANY